MKLLIVSLVVFLVSFTTKTPAEYTWNKDYKVKISDFQIEKNMPSGQLAYMNSGIQLNRNYNGTYSFRVTAIANRQMSRVSDKVVNGFRTQEILDHEQLHFDISEYVARLANSRLINIKDPTIADLIFNKYVNILHDIQDIYDAQTNHSNDPVWQQKWRLNINRLLAEDDPGEDWIMYP